MRPQARRGVARFWWFQRGYSPTWSDSALTLVSQRHMHALTPVGLVGIQFVRVCLRCIE